MKDPGEQEGKGRMEQNPKENQETKDKNRGWNESDNVETDRGATKQTQKGGKRPNYGEDC